MTRIPRIALAILALVALTILGRADDSAKNEKKPATKEVKAGDVALKVPEGWTQKPKSGGPRVVEFEIPPAGEDKTPGEFVLYFFGKDGAGGVQPNVERWIGQFEKEGRKVRTVTGESANGKYTLVDLTGTFNKPIGPPIARKTKTLPDWRVINVAIETDGGPYYLKVDGPEKTMSAIEGDLRAAFGGKKETEKPQKSE